MLEDEGDVEDIDISGDEVEESDISGDENEGDKDNECGFKESQPPITSFPD